MKRIEFVAYTQGGNWMVSWENKQGNQTKQLPIGVETSIEVLEHVEGIKYNQRDKCFVRFAQSDVPSAVRDMRKHCRLTQIKAANEIGISLASLTGIEQGKTPGVEVADKINEWINKQKTVAA